MTTRWLSDAWFDVLGAELGDVSGPPTLSGTVVVEVTGGPDGDVAGHVVFADGSVVSSGPGAVPAPDLTLTLTHEDARGVLDGDLDPSVAFMQGRMKVAGAMGPLFDLLALAGTGAFTARRARVAGSTTW